jgi:hypothetical protein
MNDRLIDLLEPQGLERHTRVLGWIAGGLAGSLVATAALLLLLLLVHLQ